MKPRGYWKDVENVKSDINTFNLGCGTPGLMPKENKLKSTESGPLRASPDQLDTAPSWSAS